MNRQNDFQKLIRSWKELAPYNAAHVLKVSGIADARRWKEAFNRVLPQIQLDSGVRLETVDLALEEAVERELNRPFTRDEPPVRATVVRGLPGAHFLITVYDHWFADSPSIRVLMERVFHAYRKEATGLPAIRFREPTQSTAGARVNKLRGLVAGLRTYYQHRRACRIDLQNPLNFHTGFFAREFKSGVIASVRAMARRQNFKVNDVFIAAAAQVLGVYTSAKRAASRKRFFHARRNQVSIASAVDLRDSAPDAPVFGFDVGYYSVVLDRPEEIPLGELAHAVAKASAPGKTKRHAAGFSLNVNCARLFWRLYSAPHQRAQLFTKGMPLLGAISNANLSASWIEQATASAGEPRLLDYLRVSPLGPIVPLIFTLTTVGDRLSLCVSFRTSAFSPAIAKQLGDEFMARISDFGS